MYQIFDERAIELFALPNALIIPFKQSEAQDRMVVAYRMLSLENFRMTSVTKSVYQLAKFGNHFRSFEMQMPDYLRCRTVFLPPERSVFAAFPNGEARLFDNEAHTKWQGVMQYKNGGPADIALYGHTLWASFPDTNALIRFNLRTMREELRIGGGAATFAQPCGLYVEGDEMKVCNPGSNKVWNVSLKSYTVFEYITFEEPVYEYCKVQDYMFVRLASGVYLLDPKRDVPHARRDRPAT